MSKRFDNFLELTKKKLMEEIMKKLLALLLVVTGLFTLAACRNGAEDNANATPGPGNGNNDNGSDVTPEPTIVRLTHWGLGTEEENNLMRRRVARFNDIHMDIQIEIIPFEGDYVEWLTAQAAAGELPDVFPVLNVPDFVTRGWLADISIVAIDDAEWDLIPEALRREITYDGRILAVPEAFHYLGFYANLDLIELSGSDVDFTNFDFTLEEFTAAVRAMRDTSGITDGSGTIGLINTFEFVNWVPSILDTSEEIGHFVWNGTQFNFRADYLNDALELSADLFTNDFTFESFGYTGVMDTPSERENIFGTNNAMAAFFNGSIGFIWDASWGASGVHNNVDELFNYDFVGLPGGRVIGVSDYLGISATADVEAAYVVARWLTFGVDGINAAFDIIDEAAEEGVTLTMNGMPMNETPAISERWFEAFPKPGFQRAFEAAADGTLEVLVEGNKSVPGFIEARFTFDTGIDAQISRPDAPAGATLSIGDLIWDAGRGEIVLSEHMDTALANALNARFQAAQDAFETALD